jgi:Holliday junction DNA helicase RuvB
MTDLLEKDIECLTKMLEFEKNKPKEEWQLGWEWHQVGVMQGTINKFITMGLVERTFSSRSTKAHVLTEKAKTILEHREQAPSMPAIVPVGDMDFSHMFNDIVGYEDLKELLRECLQVDKPIHVLLVGPPALAKTLFLWDIENAWGEHAMWLVGSATSRAGLWDAVAEKRPRIILIDELDKMSATDTAALLSLMEKGRLVRMKVNRRLDIELDVWVIACANRIYKMSPELLSRFKVYQINEYNALEFRNVVTNALVSHESLSQDEASEIALRLVGKTHDVRDAVRVARLSKRVGIQRAVELLVGR